LRIPGIILPLPDEEAKYRRFQAGGALTPTGGPGPSKKTVTGGGQDGR
jgi:hypothetical protein